MDSSHRSDLSERILVVEDEQIVALDIRLHLERFGYTVVASIPEAEEALRFLEENRDSLPDLVIMDIHLQGEMDGVTAADIIHTQFLIPIIFMTAYADDETLGRAKVSEPFAYIIKPFEERELKTAIVLALYRHRMGTALRQREHLLSGIMESIDDGVVVTDQQWVVQYANSHSTAATGTKIEAGTSLGEILPPGLVEELTSTATGERRRWEQSLDSLPGVRTIEVRMYLLTDANPSIVWIFSDRTEQLERERAIEEQKAQLEYSRRMDAVGRMSAGLAHDFNNLVTVMMGYARLALDDTESEPYSQGIRESIQGLYDTARRSAELTRRLLAFSRVPVTRPEPVRIDELVHGLETMITGVLPEYVQMQATFHAEGATVLIDSRRLQQIVINLVLNARDAMPQGGIIYISTEAVRLESPLVVRNRTLASGRYVVLSVTDTGEGIPPEQLSEIFEPFFTTKDETQGSGFGLATVYSAVAESDGGIVVTSTLGRGARFSIYFPVLDDSSATCSVPVEQQADLRGTGTVLIVEEESGVRSMMANVLRSHGYNPVVARSVGDGVLLLPRYPACEIVISDLSAPFHSTAEIVTLYRNAAPRVRIVITFAGQRVDGGQQCDLMKPFDSHDLLRLLKRLE